MKTYTRLVFLAALALTNKTLAQQWWDVGSPFFSAGGVSYTSIAIDGSGTPYVAYVDEANSNKATVMKYDGSSWVTVGSAGFSAGTANYISIAIGNSLNVGIGTPYVVYQDGGNSNKATVMKYNGSNWETVGSAGFSTGSAAYTSISVSDYGINVAYQDGGNSNKAMVMHYIANAWSTVGSGATSGISSGAASYISLMVAPNGILYVAYRGASGTGYKLTVRKNNLNSFSIWQTVGTADFSFGQVYFTSMAFDAYGNPYVAYTEGDLNFEVSVKKFNGSSWVTVGSATIAGSLGYYATLAIDGSLTPTPYVAYSDGGNSGKATVKKYDGSNWVAVGSDGISDGSASYTSIAIAPNGTPFVVYRDEVNSSKATVKQYSTNPLPVELVSLVASTKNNTIELLWKTATEVDNEGWEVQRKNLSEIPSPIVNWMKIGFVSGSGTVTSPHQYSFVDPNLSPGRYAYRLKQIDRTGTSTYSKEMQVFVGSAPREFSLGQNYPNPFNPTTTIDFTLEHDGQVTLKIYDILGRDVATLFNAIGEAGKYYQMEFHATKLSSGVYFAGLQSGDKVQLKKMMLMK